MLDRLFHCDRVERERCRREDSSLQSPDIESILLAVQMRAAEVEYEDRPARWSAGKDASHLSTLRPTPKLTSSDDIGLSC
jgi:hypothetical protein